MTDNKRVVLTGYYTTARGTLWGFYKTTVKIKEAPIKGHKEDRFGRVLTKYKVLFNQRWRRVYYCVDECCHRIGSPSADEAFEVVIP